MTRTTPARPLTHLERLDARDVPSAASTNFILPTPTEAVATPGPHRYAVGSAAGDPGTANVYDADTNALVKTVTPFGATFTGGVRVATGDLTGDGIDDLVVGTGVGAPKVKVYDGATGKLIANCAPSGDPSAMGNYVAVGDVTGDGRADLVIGDGGRGWVSVVRGQSLSLPNYRVALIPPPVYGVQTGFDSGVRVAVGDVNGDGIGDIIASSASGTPAVKLYQSRGVWDQAKQPNGPSYNMISVPVGGTAGGAFVSSGDFNGDGIADVAVGRTISGSPTVTIFNGSRTDKKLMTAYGFGSTESSGVPVAVKTTSSGKSIVVTGAGAGSSTVRVFGTTGELMRSFRAFDATHKAGVFVG